MTTIITEELAEYSIHRLGCISRDSIRSYQLRATLPRERCAIADRNQIPRPE